VLLLACGPEHAHQVAEREPYLRCNVAVDDLDRWVDRSRHATNSMLPNRIALREWRLRLPRRDAQGWRTTCFRIVGARVPLIEHRNAIYLDVSTGAMQHAAETSPRYLFSGKVLAEGFVEAGEVSDVPQNDTHVDNILRRRARGL
jgi:hypothetical protein